MNIIIFIIGVFVLFIFWQVWTFISSKRLVGKDILYDKLDNDITDSMKDKIGLIYFFSHSCSNCKVQTPIINKVKQRYDNVLKVNVYENSKTARALNVSGTPSIVFFGGNKIKGHFVGIKEETFIIQMLKNSQ